MDGDRFDAFARIVAAGVSRRRAIRFAAGGIAATALAVLGGGADARPRCRQDDRACSKHAQCCSGYCRQRQRGRDVCAPCESGIVCGDICCPPGAVNGCTTVNGPNGLVASCLCPEGTFYDPARNVCGCPETCEQDFDCCSGKCCQGVCCAEGQDRCCGGVCATIEDCVCPPGTACGGSASCTRCGVTYTTEGTCCPWPQVAYCCSDSAPDAGDGFAVCCHEDVDCPPCPVGSGWAMGARSITCDVGDCCDEDTDPDGDISLTLACCSGHGTPCLGEYPCCGVCGRDGLCTCAQEGEPCQPFGCCGTALHCDPDRRVCV